MSEQNGDLLFDDQTREQPFEFRGKKYVLREADEGTAAKWDNAKMRGAVMEGGKMLKMPDDLPGSARVLVAGCCFESLDDGKERRLTEQEIANWPARVVRPLFERAKELSDLQDATPEQIAANEAWAKNERSGSTATTA